MRIIQKIIVVASLARAFIFVEQSQAAPLLLDRVVAVVGDEPLLQSEVQQLKERLEKSPALGQIYRINPKNVTIYLLVKRMIDEKVVRYTLKELDITVTESEVDNQIANITKQNNMTIEQLKESLQNENIPWDIYRKNIRAQFERRNIFDHELRRGGGVSENDLRKLYDAKARPEASLTMISAKTSKDSLKIKAEIQSKKISLKQIEEKFVTEDLGWVNPESLDEKVSKLLSTANIGDVVGPVVLEKEPQLFLLRERRKGSEDEFQKAKTELSMEAQSADYERRFEGWLERKKKEMNIVVNPL